MIWRDRSEMNLVCDTCEADGKTYDTDDFNRMIADAKEAGWRITIEKGEWTHKCPACAGVKGDFEAVQL